MEIVQYGEVWYVLDENGDEFAGPFDNYDEASPYVDDYRSKQHRTVSF